MNNLRRLSFLSTVLLLCVGLFPTRVQADSIRVTKGNVESILYASQTGGMTIIWNTNEAAGYHSGFVDYTGEYGKGSIRPYYSYNKKHYCVNDWHVILIGIYIGGVRSSTYDPYVDASNHLSQVELSFNLDNEPLPTTRISVKRFLVPLLGWDEAYGFQEGAILAPGELGVGEHSLDVYVYEPTFDELPEIDDTLGISFFVDDNNSPACN